MLRLLRERIAAGVEIRVIGKIEKKVGVEACSLPDLRLHVRAIVRDGASVFIGSQSLRKPELDARREIGLIVNDSRIARKVKNVFEADWALARKKSGDSGVETRPEEATAVAVDA
jgi:phosphatidylserine/phosphatidylglycerophosphate/cardiolipin synthase-like enzyme